MSQWDKWTNIFLDVFVRLFLKEEVSLCYRVFKRTRFHFAMWQGCLDLTIPLPSFRSLARQWVNIHVVSCPFQYVGLTQKTLTKRWELRYYLLALNWLLLICFWTLDNIIRSSEFANLRSWNLLASITTEANSSTLHRPYSLPQEDCQSCVP